MIYKECSFFFKFWGICLEFVHRLVEKAAGRGRALLRIWLGGRSIETFGATIPLPPPTAAVDRDGTFDVVLADGCTNVAFALSFDAVNVSGVSPRLKLLFELPDDRLCKCEEERNF